MKKISERLFEKGIVTTVIGCVFLLVALYKWAVQNVPIVEVIEIGGYGLLFLRSKDSLIGIGKE